MDDGTYGTNMAGGGLGSIGSFPFVPHDLDEESKSMRFEFG